MSGKYSDDDPDDLEYFRSKSLDKIAASRRWTTRLIRPADSRYNSWNNCTIVMYVFNELENLPHSLSRLIFNFVRSSELLEQSKARCYNYNCRDQFFDDNCSKWSAGRRLVTQCLPQIVERSFFILCSVSLTSLEFWFFHDFFYTSNYCIAELESFIFSSLINWHIPIVWRRSVVEFHLYL